MSCKELFTDKDKCCGCGTCATACPKKAIIMKEDEYGFIYPQIDIEKCIECGKCKRVCAFQNRTETNTIHSVYAACTKNTDIKLSTSGGVYASIATTFLENGGFVFGAAFQKINNKLVAKHIEVSNEENLLKTLGSKYVQDQAAEIFPRIHELLKEGKDVFFAGTPCQVDALKSYLNKEYHNLLTIDIICHGVPSVKMFQDYCKMLEQKRRFSIEDICFRDKAQGWNLIGRIHGIKNGNNVNYNMRVSMSSYYNLFLSGTIYRESCYACKYASSHRTGDISIGDYWGIDEVQPELLFENGGAFKMEEGISCVIVNSENGLRWFNRVKNNLQIAKTDFEHISKRNGQLLHPTMSNPNRDRVLSIYKSDGYKGIEKWFAKKQGIKYYLRIIKYDYLERLKSKH